MRFELLTSNSMQMGTLLVFLFVLGDLLLSLSVSQMAYAPHSCTEGAEITLHTNASSVCLDPFELQSACTPPGGSLAGKPLCSAVSSSDAVKENFPLVQSYDNKTVHGQGIPGGEEEVIEEGQGIPGGEEEVIEEGQ
jgi:hypothetical protein